MKKKALSSLVLLILTVLFFSIMKNVEAFDLITAQEAYDKVTNNQAKLIDVRTLEEYVFVGSPALEPGGDPIAYLIPWEHLEGIDQSGNNEYSINPDFDELIEQTFGDDKNQALIIICRSGNRSTYAADRMEELGFSNIYEVDNKLREMTSYPGGRGGFQGSSYNSSYSGYRGYPGRLSSGPGSSSIIKVQTITDNIDSEDDSVSWMDTGLPMTQKTDPDKIPKIKREAPANVANESRSVLQTTRSLMNYQGFNYQWISNYLQQPSYSFSFYQSPLSQSLFPYSQQFLSFQPYSWYQPNQSFYQSSNIFYGVPATYVKPSNQSSCQKKETGSA